MKNFVVVSATVIAVMMAAPAFSQTSPLEQQAAGDSKIAVSDAVDYLSNQAKNQREIDYAAAPIKSRNELAAYVASTPRQLSPLDRLSPSARRQFIDSLVFNEKGLASYRYADLERELSPTEIYKLLSLFGAQQTASMIHAIHASTKVDKAIMATPMLLPDHENYSCTGRATCSRSAGDICMSSC